MSQEQEQNQMNANNKNNGYNTEPEVLEQGDIYFFYRPKKDAEEVKGIEDVRRFFMVTGPEKSEKETDKSQFYRLFVSIVASTISMLFRNTYV